MPLLDLIGDLIGGNRGMTEYAEKLKLFLSDRELTDTEQKALDAIAARYGLTTKDLKTLQAAAVGDLYANMAEDERITEDEKAALERLVTHFGVTLEKTAFNQKQFLKFYTLALIENGLLPELTRREKDLSIAFDDEEILHWVCPAELRKHLPSSEKTRTIAKGSKYRVGSASGTAALGTEDSGSFYLTNKRMGFLGHKKQFAMPYSAIHSASVGRGGLTIFKKGRANPYVIALKDYDVPCSILSFIVNG